MDATLIETFLDAYRQKKKHGRVWDEAVHTSVQLAVLAKTQEQVEKKAYTILMRNPVEKEIFLGKDLEFKQEMVEELRDLIGDI
ncbi:hypothetical protein IFM89_036734 [Coptis chinensis]|uniref:Uncharacterized protein n=1 Tax=Coptis chinensis TaxID=261450 RepID=A0A835LXI1_9MAGN|nr:hypothetical protein IFM89_036734 [Coptis chinensis]